MATRNEKLGEINAVLHLLKDEVHGHNLKLDKVENSLVELKEGFRNHLSSHEKFEKNAKWTVGTAITLAIILSQIIIKLI